MVLRLRGTSFVRLAVGAAVLALPLLGAGVAQAAMGGALPLTSTFRPDLRSVTLTSSNEAQFCFDKTLSSAVGAPGDFMLGGYNSFDADITSDYTATTATQAVLDDTNPDCVDVVFPTGANAGKTTITGGSADLTQYTFGSVSAGAVVTNTHAETNDADSTSLTGSTTNNGTTGNTVAPDLTGVTINTTLNSVSYVFNKNIGGINLGSGSGFFIINSGGQVCREDTASNVTFSGNVVTVVYPTSAGGDCSAFTEFPKPVDAAVRAGVDGFDVFSATAEAVANSDAQTAIVPGTSGTTGLADLVSAVVSSDGNTIAFTFDKPIGSVPDPGEFVVALADGDSQDGSGTPTINNTATTGTVTVPFASGSTFNEYDVKASVYPGATTVLNEPGSGNTYGSVPVGDNAGAFARGFTTGPDATGVTFNSTTGDAVVSFDQRVNLSNIATTGFVLLDQDGTPVASATPTGASGVPSAAGPVQVTVSFPPAAFSVAKALEICGPPDGLNGISPGECVSSLPDAAPAKSHALQIISGFNGTVFSSFEDDPNVQQILTPFATSSVLTSHGTFTAKAKKHARHAKRLSRKAFARQLKAAERRAKIRARR